MCASNSGKVPADTLNAIILPDGRIRLETGSFAGAAHTSADKFLQVLLAELGVDVEERTSLGHVHHHHHNHDHLKLGGKK
jgi:hypothetical protein